MSMKSDTCANGDIPECVRIDKILPKNSNPLAAAFLIETIDRAKPSLRSDCPDEAIPTCTNVDDNCAHADINVCETSIPLRREEEIKDIVSSSSPSQSKRHRRRRRLKFDELNTLLGCATVDVGVGVSGSSGAVVVDYDSGESCCCETCAPSWLGGGCCCKTCAGLRAQVWNMYCKNFQIGDIAITTLSSSDIEYNIRLGFSDIAGRCDFDWKYWTTGNVWGVSDIDSGTNSARATIDGATAYLDVKIGSVGFNGDNAQPPTTAEISSCTASVDVDVNVDLGGTISNFFGNGFVTLLTSTVNAMAKTIICTIVGGYEIDWSKLTLGIASAKSQVVEPMVEQLIEEVLVDVNEIFDPYDVDILPLQDAARIAEEKLNRPTQEDFATVDLEYEKLFVVIRNVLDGVLSDTVTNEYGQPDIAINQLVRSGTREGTIAYDAASLDPTSRVLMDKQSMFMDIRLTMNKVEISNIDKFTRVDLLHILRDLTGRDEAITAKESMAHEGFSLGAEMTFSMRPPSSDTAAVTFDSNCAVDGLAYNMRLDFSISDLDIEAALLAAIDKSKYDALTLAELLSNSSASACLLNTLVFPGVSAPVDASTPLTLSAVFATVASMADPTVSGIGDADLQNLLNTAVSTMFDMYGPYIWRLLPSVVDTFVTNATNEFLDVKLSDRGMCEPPVSSTDVWTCAENVSGTYTTKVNTQTSLEACKSACELDTKCRYVAWIASHGACYAYADRRDGMTDDASEISRSGFFRCALETIEHVASWQETTVGTIFGPVGDPRVWDTDAGGVCNDPDRASADSCTGYFIDPLVTETHLVEVENAPDVDAPGFVKRLDASDCGSGFSFSSLSHFSTHDTIRSTSECANLCANRSSWCRMFLFNGTTCNLLSAQCDGETDGTADAAAWNGYVPLVNLYDFDSDWIFSALSDITDDVLRDFDADTDEIRANSLIRGATGYDEEGQLYMPLDLDIIALQSPLTGANGSVRLHSVLLSNLDSLVDFQPLVNLKNYTVESSVLFDRIDIAVNFSLAMIPDRSLRIFTYADGVRCANTYGDTSHGTFETSVYDTVLARCSNDAACVGFQIQQTTLGDCSFGCATLCSTLAYVSDSTSEVYFASAYAAYADTYNGCTQLYCNSTALTVPATTNSVVGTTTRRFSPSLSQCEAVWQSMCVSGTMSTGDDVVTCRSNTDVVANMPFETTNGKLCTGEQEETVMLSTGLTGVGVDIAATVAINRDTMLNTSLGQMGAYGPLACIARWIHTTNVTKMSMSIGTSWSKRKHAKLVVASPVSSPAASASFADAKLDCLQTDACVGLYCPSLSHEGMHPLCYAVVGTGEATFQTEVGSTSYLRDSSGMVDPSVSDFKNVLFEDMFALFITSARYVFRDLFRSILPSVTQNVVRNIALDAIDTYFLSKADECPESYTYFDVSQHGATTALAERLASDDVDSGILVWPTIPKNEADDAGLKFSERAETMFSTAFGRELLASEFESDVLDAYPVSSSRSACIRLCRTRGYADFGCELRYGTNERTRGCYGVAPPVESPAYVADPVGMGIPELREVLVGDFILDPSETEHATSGEAALVANPDAAEILERNDFYDWTTNWIVQAIVSELDASLTGPNENGEVGLNSVMENVADEDGTVAIGINATIIKNLTNPATGEAVSLRLTSIGFDGLTSFSKFDPIRPISNYTIGTYVGISSLGMDLNFTLTLTDPTYDENVEETVIVRTGLNETMLEIAIMAALVESEFNAIHLGSLLMSNVDPMDTNSLIDAFWNATRCLMQPLFAVELASLNLTIDNLIEPTLEGIGFETKLISRGTAHDDDRENILSYHWKSGDDVWSDDNTTQWADLGYFEDSAFDVVVRGTKCSHGQIVCEDAVTNGSDTLFREIEIPRDAQVFALYSASDEATIGSLLTGWTRCDDAQQYMDAYMIAKAALDAITAQYEAYLETHPWGFDKTPNISRAWTPAHCTDSSITVSPSNWSAAFCSDPSIVDEHFCVGTWDDDGDEFNGTTPNVTRKWSDDGFCTNPEHRTRSSCVGNYTLDDGTIFVEEWLVSSCTDTAVVERSECSGVFTLSRAWSNGRCNDPAVTAEGDCVGNVQLERYWVERGLCNDAKVTIEAQCVGTFDDDDDGHRNGTMPVPRVWHSGTGPACVGPWDPDENPSTPAVERLWIAAACNDPAIATENECVETFDDDQDGGTADVDRTWTCVDSSCRCSDPDVVVQIECAGTWDDDGDGAGYTVFEQLENDLAREESIRDDALASYDPFRGRSAIPTTSDLGAYYVSTTTRTFDACRGYYFDAGTVRLPALDNAALFLRFFPSLSDTASIVTMGIEAMSIVFREVVHPALPSLLHNVIRSTFNRVVRDALADAHSNYNCSVPERRYEEDGSPYIIKWGEKEYDDGQITYSWFANLTHTLVADYISPATALSNSTDANALLSSALPPNGCYPKSHIDGNGSCVGAESMDRSRLVQPETLLQWSTESAITQFSWLRTMTPVHLGFLDGFIANLGLRNLASIKDVTFLEAMSESYDQDPEQTYILKNAISVAGPLIVSVDWFMAWVANISESKRQWTVVSTTDHQGAETVAGCTDPSIESLEIDCKGTWDPSTHATVCPVKKGVFEGTPQCPAQISPLNTFWSNAMEIYAAPKDIFLVFDFMAKISEYKFLTLRLDQLKYPSCWLATFADRCDKVYTDSPPLVAAVKSLRFEIGEMEASINCAIGSEGTMPIRRTWINPSCGVLSDPSSGEQIIYASGQCTGVL